MKTSSSTIKNFIIFLILFSFFALSVSVWLFIQNYQETRNSINKRLQQQSERLSVSFVDSIEYTEHIMRYIEKQVISNGSKNYRFIRKLLESYKLPDNKIAELSTFAWVNNKHRYIVSSNGGFHFDEFLDLSKRDYIPKTVSDPFKIHLGEPIYGIYSKKYSIPAGYGVVSKKGRYLGAVVTGFTVDGIQKKLDEVINLEGISFALMDSEGAIISHSPKAKIEKIKENFSEHLLGNVSGMIHEIKLFAKESDYGSIYLNKIDGYPYQIVTIYDRDLEGSEIEGLLFKQVLVVIFLLIMVTVLLMFFYNNIIAPIIKLYKSAEMISAGKLDVKIPSSDIREINSLARALSDIRNFVKNETDMRRKLNQYNQTQTKLIRATSHDLRNYIFGISGLAQLILLDKNQEQIDSDEGLKLTKTISEQSVELMYFVEDLLDISSHDENVAFSIKKLGDCNIGFLVERMVLLNKNFAISSKVDVKVDIPKNIPHLKCDIRRFKQIFNNLITNSIKYSKPHKSIIISAKHLKKNNQICIEIKDEGIGMNEREIKMALSGDGENIDKTSLKKEVDSHGVGLPNVQQLVEMHKGKMEIESVKGEGTIVRLYFDLGISEELDVSGSSLKLSKSLLIVDDEKINLLVTKTILEKNLKIPCDIAENGLQALNIFEKNPDKYEAILMDLEMPIMDGFEAIEKIKELDSKIPIIAYSSLRKSQRKAFEAGGDDYLLKPATKDVLSKVVARWIDFKYDPLATNSLDDLKGILSGSRILVADDEAVNIMMLTRYIKSFGAQVIEVRDGESLVDEFVSAVEKGEKYDLVIADINMPKLGGDKAAERIRAYEVRNELLVTPIIAFTGDAQKDIINKFFKSGMNDYFQKGDSNDDLLKILAFWLHVKFPRF